MRAVLDTNILVSMALARGGRFDAIWRAWREGQFEVLTCRELVDEVRAVLGRPKISKILDSDLCDALLRDLAALTNPVALIAPWPEFRDPNDRFLLALARDGPADVLVTVDAALQDLVRFGDTVITSPADFMEALR